MCWSWEVSLVFFIFDILGVIYVFHRNQYIDRYFVLLLIPFVAQEFCSFIVWKFGIDPNVSEPESHSHCNELNKINFVIISTIVGTIPVSCAYILYKTSLGSGNYKKWIADFLFKYLYLFEVIMFFVLKILAFAFFNPETTKQCIFIGTHGHQVWSPPTFVLINDDVFEAIFYVCYLTPIVCALSLYKPLWVLFVPNLVEFTLYILLRLFYGPEGYSIWCWSGVCVISWCIAYVHIAKCIINKRGVFARAHVKNTCINKLVSYETTQQHMIKYKVIPQLISQKDDNGTIASAEEPELVELISQD